MKGVEGGHDGMPGEPRDMNCSGRPPSAGLNVANCLRGSGRATGPCLARAITFMESNAPAHQEEAQELLEALMDETGRSLRIGITGVPGAGKSTLIETLGDQLCKAGHKVAVLAVDPSSSVTKGSILGDKTRMEKLSRHPKSAFVRPSPTGGCLGGVARKTRETLLLCEAFGFDIILLETVGCGAERGDGPLHGGLFPAGHDRRCRGRASGHQERRHRAGRYHCREQGGRDNVRNARMAKAEYNRVLSFLQP
jgi:LAO/AO transport system kinase